MKEKGMILVDEFDLSDHKLSAPSRQGPRQLDQKEKRGKKKRVEKARATNVLIPAEGRKQQVLRASGFNLTGAAAPLAEAGGLSDDGSWYPGMVMARSLWLPAAE